MIFDRRVFWVFWMRWGRSFMQYECVLVNELEFVARAWSYAHFSHAPLNPENEILEILMYLNRIIPLLE